MPRSALVGIAVSYKLEIVFDTVDVSRKYSNLITRPKCSFVIGWTGEQTVQYEGDACKLSGGELKQYQADIFRAWPESSTPDLGGMHTSSSDPDGFGIAISPESASHRRVHL